LCLFDYQLYCDQKDTRAIAEAVGTEVDAEKGLTLLKHMAKTSDSFSITNNLQSSQAFLPESIEHFLLATLRTNIFISDLLTDRLCANFDKMQLHSP